MDLNDRISWFIFGMALGLVIGYIVRVLQELRKDVSYLKEELDEVDDMVKEAKGEKGFMRNPIVADIAYLFALLLILFGLWRMNSITEDVQEKSHEDLVALCQAGTENRNVEREMVDQIYNLAIGAAQRDENSPPLTKAELAQYNAYIDRVNDFRENLYSKISPAKECAPYVEDDHVAPPTPPTPHLTNSETRA